MKICTVASIGTSFSFSPLLLLHNSKTKNMKANSFTSNSSGITFHCTSRSTRLKVSSFAVLIALCLFLLPTMLMAQALDSKTYKTPLREFEGFFQLPNKVAYLEITQQGNDLLAKQVWDKREYLLIRKSDLEFESKNEEYQCMFIKDASGKIVSLKAMNRIILTKVNFNPNHETVLAPNKLRVLEGKYQFSKDKQMFIELSAKDNSILLKQQWDGKVIVFSPLSETNFYNKEMRFPLTVIKENDVVRQVICFENDIWDKI